MVDVCLRLIFLAFAIGANSFLIRNRFLSQEELFPFAIEKGFIRNLTLRRIRGNEIVHCL